jgi:hypothetical protein
MFQRIIAYLLICTIISTHFSKIYVFAGFELNKNYIAAQLCENKNKPQLQCFGKCFLKKKLEQAEKKQAQQERQNQKNLFQEIATVNNHAFCFKTSLVSEINTPVQLNYNLVSVFPIFHPPA